MHGGRNVLRPYNGRSTLRPYLVNGDKDAFLHRIVCFLGIRAAVVKFCHADKLVFGQ